MPATALARVFRYARPGITKLVSMPAVAAIATPSRIEINAGKDVTFDLANAAGFTVDGAKIDTPDWGSRFVSSVPGRITPADSSITWYADKSGADVRAQFVQDQVAFIAFMDGGDVAALKMDVYKTQVLSVSSTKDGDNAVQVTVSFSFTDYAAQAPIPV